MYTMSYKSISRTVVYILPSPFLCAVERGAFKRPKMPLQSEPGTFLILLNTTTKACGVPSLGCNSAGVASQLFIAAILSGVSKPDAKPIANDSKSERA